MDGTARHLLKETRAHGDDRFPLAVYKLFYSAGSHVLDTHWHPEAEFFYVVEGEVLFQVDTDFFPVKAGEAVYLDGGDIHAGYARGDAGCRFEALVIDLAFLASGGFDVVQEQVVLPLIEKKRTFPRIIRPDSEGERRILDLIGTIMNAYEAESPGFEPLVKGCLYLALAELAQAGLQVDRSGGGSLDSVKVERLKTVIGYIQEHFQRPLRIKELADLLPMSEGQFCRFFKTMTGKTPIEYINSFRIRQATELIRQTDRKLSDIALDTGFDNISYFSKVFRNETGYSPSDYRKRDR
ncbi:AraC family transcriptional regulator [Gorillibacterium timonense]|uniref:AraC family transcriptional regulator n=1 Tax=Gorillibacterium timonense TaxID=1689269 RepID=UPI00071C87D1|nr:AraC family transcriptional regulator [Gorillibacterium timonense]